jgi:hypothetical protein
LSTINALFAAFAFAFLAFLIFAFFRGPDFESESESEIDDDDDDEEPDDDDEPDDEREDEPDDDDESPSTPNRIVNAFLRDGFTTGFGLLEKKEVDGSSVETFSEIGLFANRAKNSFIVSNLIYLS